MILTEVSLQDFRAFESARVRFDAKLNLILGRNAQGKTSLIESIFVGAFGKSFRGQKDADMVCFGAEQAGVRIGFYNERYGAGSVEYRIRRDGSKSFRVNGVNVTKINALLGNLRIVLFHPEDLRLIKDGPGERRSFLNRELSNLSMLYCNDLIEYNRILIQRNALLKRVPVKDEEIGVWDEQLAQKAQRLVTKRLSYIEQLNRNCNQIHRSITSGEEIDVQYMANLDTTDMESYSERMVKKLRASLSMDIKRGFTSVGPHRDDLEVRIGGKPAKIYGSQGQQRTAALSLKLSEIQIIRDETGEAPVLLLDDVMSELDLRRQRELIRAFEDVQVVLTTTDAAHIVDAYIAKSRQIIVENGTISTQWEE